MSRLIQVLGIGLVLLLAACGGAGGGTRPLINSFTATPASLPVGGGSTTLAWNVTGATAVSIDQGVGAVTPVTSGSTSKSVTATTVFTLTATNAAGSVTQPVTVSVAAAPATVTVSGKVVNSSGAAVSGASVLLNGGGLFTTGADGSFSYSGVTTPYNLTVKVGSVISEYRGLTRPNPQISTSLAGVAYTGTISGNVTGPAYPLAAGDGILMGATGRAFTPGVVAANSATGAYNMPVLWSGNSTLTTDVVALRFQFSGGVFTNFVQTGKKSGVSISSGSALSGQNVALDTSVTTASTVLTYNAGAYTTGTVGGYWNLRASGGNFVLAGAVPVASGGTAKYPGDGASFYVTGNDGTGNSAILITPAVSGATNVNLPAAVALQNAVPAAGATGVSKTPTLSWSNVSGSTMYVLTVSGAGFTYRFHLTGGSSTFAFPDYSVLSAALAGATAYSWSVQSYQGSGFSPDEWTDSANPNFYNLYTTSSLTLFNSGPTAFTTVP